MKKIVKRLAAMLCVIGLFVVCEALLRYLLIDDAKNYTRYSRYNIHELYHSEQNIDILFVGSSHSVVSLIPEITDYVFGQYTFNAGTAGQRMDGSFAMIQEAADYHHINHIYLEMYYAFCSDYAYKDRTLSDLEYTYLISDYMRPSVRKMKYLLNASSKEYYMNSFIPATRNWEQLFDPEYMKSILRQKNTDAYKNYEWVGGDFENRGYVYTAGVVADDKFWNAEAYYDMTSTLRAGGDSDWRRSLQCIIDFCRKNGIELTLFSTPMPEWTIAGIQYQQYIDMCRRIAEEYGIEYYDFNLCREEYFDANDRSLFSDEDHMNNSGAMQFSVLFAKFFTGQLPDQRGEIFYGTYDEKLAAEAACVYGIAGPAADESGSANRCRIISNREQGMEYRITVIPQDRETVILQDYDGNRDFTLPAGETGMLYIDWRMADQPNESGRIETVY